MPSEARQLSIEALAEIRRRQQSEKYPTVSELLAHLAWLEGEKARLEAVIDTGSDCWQLHVNDEDQIAALKLKLTKAAESIRSRLLEVVKGRRDEYEQKANNTTGVHHGFYRGQEYGANEIIAALEGCELKGGE